jgi:hypothetical protein
MRNPWKFLHEITSGPHSQDPGSDGLGSLRNRQMNEVLWLQDLLPDVVPNSRIMTFGYQSNYFKSAPKRNIANCAQELLITLKAHRETNSVRLPCFVMY